MRCQVDGKVTVLIFTKKSVKKGENLLYDYNEAKNMYPTDEFVWEIIDLIVKKLLDVN